MLALCALAPATAAAQTPTLQSTTPDDRAVALYVRDSGDLRCLSVAVGGEAPRRSAPCAAAPRNVHEDARGLRVVYRATPEKLAIIYGLVSSDTKSLKVRLGDGRLITIKPSGGAYLRVLGGRAPVAAINALDARGVPRGAFDFDPRAVRFERGPFTLLSVPDERGNRGLLTAFTALLYRERSTRRALHACVAVSARRQVPAAFIEPGYSGGAACTTSTRRLVVKYAAGCEAKRVLLYGIAPTAVRTLTLVTESGRRIPARTARFTRQLKRSGRAFVISVPDPGRLARLDAFARDGQRIASVPLSAVGSGCGASSRS